MNRKILAGAAASLMLTSLPVAITAAGASPVKPTVTSVSVTHDANHQFLDSSTVAANETFTIVVTGTGFNSGSYSLDAKATPGITADSITKNSSTQVTIEAHTGLGLGIAGKVLNDAKYTLTVPAGGNSGGGTVKFTTHETSNCGTVLPLAQAGKTYGVDNNGTQIINAAGTNYTGSDAAVTYFDVNVAGGPLCTGDLLGLTEPPKLTTFGFPSWGINYPINMTGSSASRLSMTKTNPDYGNGKISAVGFNFPYTTATTLKVIGSVTTYKLVGFKGVAGCEADTSNTVAIDSCVATPKGIVVTSTATRNYSQGDTIQSPVIKITGISGKTSPLQIIPVSNVSTIKLGASTLDITFAPRARSANASYAPISYSAS